MAVDGDGTPINQLRTGNASSSMEWNTSHLLRRFCNQKSRDRPYLKSPESMIAGWWATPLKNDGVRQLG